MRPLKIALVSQWYWQESLHHHDDDEGGSARQLAEAVAALGNEVIVLTQSPDVRTLKQYPIGSLETWVSPRDRSRDLFTRLRDWMARKSYSYSQIYSDALALRDFLAKRGPFDVIWAHSESPDGLAIAMAAKLGVKLPPVLLQVQALRYRFTKAGPKFIETKPLQFAFSCATRIVASSEMVAESILAYAGPGLSAEALKAKTRIIYPNLQRAFFRATQETAHVAGPMQDRVLFVGTLEKPKGALIYLQAIPKTEASKRISTFALIGDFTECNRRNIKRWEEAQEQVRLKLPGAKMEYLGRVSSYEVIRQIRLAQVVVVPSLFDPFSRSVLEALALGRPVITTDRVGASQLVRDHGCGVVVAPNDPDALARAIDVVLSPLVPFAEKARQIGPRLLHEFSSEAIARQLTQHLIKISGLADQEPEG
jgi:glycosyltransferase involved in cell wall biosynthesis